MPAVRRRAPSPQSSSTERPLRARPVIERRPRRAEARAPSEGSATVPAPEAGHPPAAVRPAGSVSPEPPTSPVRGLASPEPPTSPGRGSSLEPLAPPPALPEALQQGSEATSRRAESDSSGLRETSEGLEALGAMGLEVRLVPQITGFSVREDGAIELIVQLRPTLGPAAHDTFDAFTDMLAARQLAENQQAAAEGMAREAPRTIGSFEQILRELHASESDGAWGTDGVEGFHEDLLEGVPALALARSLGEPAPAELELFRDATESPAWAALRAQVVKHCGSDPRRRQALLDDIAQAVRHKQDLASPALASQAARQVLAAVHDADRLGLASCLELAWKRGPWAEAGPV